ncbi:MAG TPA: hypothetical protein ENK18_03165 [Deltaproteobacteria bacterium]|nr:hypothetical protein [Deltaproteobacteria bacterium]
MSFLVDKVYYIPHRDLLVLAGRPDPSCPQPGGQIDLPREIRGPGWVAIRDVQSVSFADGTRRLCAVLDYEVVTSTPFMEFSDLEGLSLQLRPP